jgi:hypothetical protein
MAKLCLLAVGKLVANPTSFERVSAAKITANEVGPVTLEATLYFDCCDTFESFPDQVDVVRARVSYDLRIPSVVLQ